MQTKKIGCFSKIELLALDQIKYEDKNLVHFSLHQKIEMGGHKIYLTVESRDRHHYERIIYICTSHMT